MAIAISRYPTLVGYRSDVYAFKLLTGHQWTATFLMLVTLGTRPSFSRAHPTVPAPLRAAP